jgi:hypothetical protein
LSFRRKPEPKPLSFRRKPEPNSVAVERLQRVPCNKLSSTRDTRTPARTARQKDHLLLK